jgi:hypothetical protein
VDTADVLHHSLVLEGKSLKELSEGVEAVVNVILVSIAAYTKIELDSAVSTSGTFYLNRCLGSE